MGLAAGRAEVVIVLAFLGECRLGGSREGKLELVALSDLLVQLRA
jgi:hypothetical protein